MDTLETLKFMISHSTERCFIAESREAHARKHVTVVYYQQKSTHQYGSFMPFVKDDPNINRKGRGTGESLVNPKSLTGTEYREKEFKQILRRLKPLNNKALKVFTDMLEDEKTTEATKVKVAVFIMKTYQDMMDDLYKPVNAGGSSDDEDQDDKPLAPIISFNVREG